MSREIKFRAWNGKKMRGIEKNDFFSIRNDGELSIQLPDTDFSIPLMQFTGLKDKNGVEIYEGDIIHDSNFLDDCNHEVLFLDDIGGWYMCDTKLGYAELLSEYTSSSKVIGDRFSNPELLPCK